ncbi:MFS transporter [Microbacterium sp. NPDC058342]|uniref:MFS transporter n=1 Tax=Microbacterium sp. NPDC058342 TaxID=3346454 RepID=UPI0036460FF5
MSGGIHVLIGCYFVASFAALGLPPYLTEILPGLGDAQAAWAGVLYVVPTVFAAVAAPLWGRLADRFGPRRMLLRAQSGLALAFVLAGIADSVVVLAVALMLQGVLGGTYAATQAYLGSRLDARELGTALVLLQGAARAALLIAPLTIGALSHWISPQHQYLWFAALPAATAVLVLTLPRQEGSAKESAATLRPGGDVSPWLVCAVEAGFVLATVITYPYFLRQMTTWHPGLTSLWASALFALPHVLYLVSAAFLHARTARRPMLALRTGLLAVAAGAASIALPLPIPVVIAGRLVFGIGMALALVALAQLASRAVRPESSGRTFGVIELFSKLGAVAAGLLASASSTWSPVAPFLIGAAVAGAFAVLLPSHIPGPRRAEPLLPHLTSEQR